MRLSFIIWLTHDVFRSSYGLHSGHAYEWFWSYNRKEIKTMVHVLWIARPERGMACIAVPCLLVAILEDWHWLYTQISCTNLSLTTRRGQTIADIFGYLFVPTLCHVLTLVVRVTRESCCLPAWWSLFVNVFNVEEHVLWGYNETWCLCWTKGVYPSEDMATIWSMQSRDTPIFEGFRQWMLCVEIKW